MFHITSVTTASNENDIDVVLLQSDQNGETFSVLFDEEGRFIRANRLSDGADMTEYAALTGMDSVAREGILQQINYAELFSDDEDISEINLELSPVR